MNYDIKELIDLEECDDVEIDGVDVDDGSHTSMYICQKDFHLCSVLNADAGCITKELM